MKTLLCQFWRDESGALLSSEILLVGTLLVVGSVAGLTAFRDTVVSEFSDLALAIGSLNQSFCFGGTMGHCAWTSGSRFYDTFDVADVPVAVCVPTALCAEAFGGTGYAAGVGGYGYGGGGGGGGFTNIGARPPAAPLVRDFPAPVSYTPAAAPCAVPVAQPFAPVAQPCATAPCATPACGGCCVQIIVNGVPLTTGCKVSTCPKCYPVTAAPVAVAPVAVGPVAVAPYYQPQQGAFTAVIPDGSLPPQATTFVPVPHPAPAMHHHHHGPRTESMELRFNEITDEELKDIKDADRVKVLRINASKITNNGLANLSGLKNLEELYIVGGLIDDGGLQHLKGLVKLRVLDIRGTKVTEQGLQALSRQMPKLDD